MAYSAEFREAVAYSLRCIHQESLVLKAKQEEALFHLYNGRDVFAWFPTGYGKSICYQLLPFMFDFKLKRTTAPQDQRSSVLVISPLVSLMVDQVSGLQKRGVNAAILSGNKDVDKELIASLSVSIVAVAVDEAHCVFKWSKDFRPSFGALKDLRAFMPPGVPMLATTATVTVRMREYIIEKLDMGGCFIVSESPNKPNICYEVTRKKTIEEDFECIIRDVAANKVKAQRVVVYCQSLDMCASLYAHFLHVLQDASYYPSDAEHISDNRLFAMFHSCTDEHNKRVVMSSLRESDSVLRVVFAMMALGMGVDFKSLDYIIYYGASRSLEDYMQESGRAGRDHQQSVFRIYWKPSEAPVYADHGVHRYKELKDVRDYLENTEHCRRFMLLKYFDPAVAMTLGSRDSTLCCDYCRSKLQ
eukprot:Em0007g1425a